MHVEGGNDNVWPNGCEVYAPHQATKPIFFVHNMRVFIFGLLISAALYNLLGLKMEQ